MSLGDSQKGKESAVNRLATPVITSQEGSPSEHRKGRVGEGENNEEREWSAGQATLSQSHLDGRQHLGVTNSKVSKITNPGSHLVN